MFTPRLTTTQRTAPCVTAPASAATFPPTMQVPRRTPLSLSLRSLGASSLLTMKLRNKILGIVSCIATVIAFQWLGMMLSFADFHPGGDVPFDQNLHRKAQLGTMMCMPFSIPLEWFSSFVISVTGGYEFVSSRTYSNTYSFVFWALLPVFYGCLLFALMLLARRLILSRSRHV